MSKRKGWGEEGAIGGLREGGGESQTGTRGIDKEPPVVRGWKEMQLRRIGNYDVLWSKFARAPRLLLPFLCVIGL